MAYITLEELKEHLPVILSDWIEPGDEGWEWIFQEIEQKCHIGKRLKGKKWKKYIEDDIYQSKSMVDAQSTAIAAHRNDINKLESKNNGLSKEFEEFKKEQEDKHKAQGDLFDMIIMRIKEIEGVLNGEEAKKHTQEIIEALKVNPEDKNCRLFTAANKCVSCKHLSKQPIDQPCIDCCYYETFAKHVGRYNKKRFNKALEEAKKVTPDEVVYNGKTYKLTDEYTVKSKEE